MYLGATVGAGSSGGIINCDKLFVMIGARRGESSGKLKLWVGTGRGGGTWYEPSGDRRLEVCWSLFRPVEEYPSEISLGGGIIDN